MKIMTIELKREELEQLIGILESNISEETKILNEAANNPASGVFDCTLASINRKAELYAVLHKALNSRHLT